MDIGDARVGEQDLAGARKRGGGGDPAGLVDDTVVGPVAAQQEASAARDYGRQVGAVGAAGAVAQSAQSAQSAQRKMGPVSA
jgi:hypothetical protein